MNGSAFDVGSAAVREVGSFDHVSGVATGRWPCTRCGDAFPARMSFGVTFVSGGRTLTCVVCPTCAAGYGSREPVDVGSAGEVGR